MRAELATDRREVGTDGAAFALEAMTDEAGPGAEHLATVLEVPSISQATVASQATPEQFADRFD